MSLPSHLPPPRLCRLKKWDTYAGYGFNLHAEKGKAGQYIGKVDPESPAELGGLKTKDYLIEVNGTNVEDLSHQNVVEKVKDISDMVTMLVIEMEAYKYCKEKGILLSSDMPEVVVYSTPDIQPAAGNSINAQESRRDVQPQPPVTDTVIEEDDEIQEEEVTDYYPSYPARLATPPPPEPEPVQQRQFESTPPTASRSPPPHSVVKSSGGSNGSGAPIGGSGSGGGKDPVGNLSLEEMRAKIGSNRRNQAKLNPSSFSEKYNMFQAL